MESNHKQPTQRAAVVVELADAVIFARYTQDCLPVVVGFPECARRLLVHKDAWAGRVLVSERA